jgi:hypothetical protein
VTTRHPRNPRPNAHDPALRIAQGGQARSQMQPPPAKTEKTRSQRPRRYLRARRVRRRGHMRPSPAAGLEASGLGHNRPPPRGRDLAQKGKLLQKLPVSARELPGTRRKKVKAGKGKGRTEKAWLNRAMKPSQQASGDYPRVLLGLPEAVLLVPLRSKRSTCGNAPVTDHDWRETFGWTAAVASFSIFPFPYLLSLGIFMFLPCTPLTPLLYIYCFAPCYQLTVMVIKN